jgi:guanylate kinase
VHSVSHTTRAPRPGERDGVEYHFVSAPEFRALVDADSFIEHAEYGGNLYGTSARQLDRRLAEGKDVLLEIEVQGAEQIKKRRADARLVFLLPPSRGELERRLRARGTDDPAVVEKRLALARRELAAVDLFEYAVVNEDLERAIADVREIMAAERAGRPEAARARHGRVAVLARMRAELGFG